MASVPKWTPGPWRWMFQGTAGRWGLVGVTGTVKVDGPPDINPNAGDMALIAAAPELYEALRLAVSVLSGEQMTKQSLVDALTESRAALAKARGE